MKKIASILIMGLFIVYANAQSHEADSLSQLLQEEERDTTRVLLLEKLSLEYSTFNTDTSLILAQEALALARKIEFEKGEAISLNRIGTVLSSIGNYPQALENYLDALKINEKIRNMDGIMRNQGNIADVNASLRDYNEALHYAFLEKNNAEKSKEELLLANALLLIGDIYEELDRLDSALIFTERAHELGEKINDDYSISIALNNLGNIYSKMHLQRPLMYPASIAMGFYRSSIDLCVAEEDYEGIAESALGMARLFKKANRMDSALHYAKQSLDAAESGNFTIYKINACRFLTDYYSEKNRLDSAFHYQQITIKFKDSLFSEEQIKRVQTLSFEERKRQQLLEEERLGADRERRNNIQLMGIAAVIVILFLFLLLISRRETKSSTVEAFGIVSLLFFFEFISLIIHPFIAEWTHHTPILMMMILVGVAALLVPLHHKMEHWVKVKLAHKIRTVSKSVANMMRTNPGRDRGEVMH
ncbi:MAG TPA: tetratricopeptide repeat protein [Chitinophagaceae bacterium]|nr:tetratricopeptide repeat protein [Chitinophagaceae bacterium]